MPRYSAVFLTASLASVAFARTDLTGCTSTDVSSPAGASIAWYVPGTGEICDFLDCGGGRAPPKTTVPGCPLYSGTATYSPSFLAGYGGATGAPSSTASGASSSSATDSSSVVVTSSASSSSAPSSTSVSSQSSQSDSTLSNGAVAITSAVTVTTTGKTSSVFTTITSSPAAGVGAGSTSSNGTSVGSGSSGSGSGSGSSSGNGTVASQTPSPIMSNSGALETARVWVGGSALIGLGALVAAL